MQNKESNTHKEVFVPKNPCKITSYSTNNEAPQVVGKYSVTTTDIEDVPVVVSIDPHNHVDAVVASNVRS